MKIRALLGLFVIAALLVQAGDQPVTVNVTPRRLFVHGDVRALVIVERDAHNRVLSVALDGSTGYYRRTDEQLDGADAPRSRDVWFRGLPDGRYLVAAIVTRADGTTRQDRQEICVYGPDEDCQ